MQAKVCQDNKPTLAFRPPARNVPSCVVYHIAQRIEHHQRRHQNAP